MLFGHLYFFLVVSTTFIFLSVYLPLADVSISHLPCIMPNQFLKSYFPFLGCIPSLYPSPFSGLSFNTQTSDKISCITVKAQTRANYIFQLKS